MHAGVPLLTGFAALFLADPTFAASDPPAPDPQSTANPANAEADETQPSAPPR